MYDNFFLHIYLIILSVDKNAKCTVQKYSLYYMMYLRFLF